MEDVDLVESSSGITKIKSAVGRRGKKNLYKQRNKEVSEIGKLKIL